MGWLEKLKQGLSRTKDNISEKMDYVFLGNNEINDTFYDELEEALILSDIGFDTTTGIINQLKKNIKENHIKNTNEAKEILRKIMIGILGNEEKTVLPKNKPTVYVVVGVNGVGKTTSIGKMASFLTNNGYSVMLAAGDTFRAAAIDQLEIWANRCNVDLIKHSEGSDPAAVIFDAVQSAKSKKIDVLICDTAGRLHNKKNLMEELKKINRVVEREFPEACKETLLVMDATTGQNALNQAKEFIAVASVNGIILTKLDGTAKGGIVLAISSELNIPVKMIGVGEGIADLQPFNPKAFVDAIL